MTGDDLRAWRQRLGLTQAAAAALVGLEISSYRGCEQGRPVSLQTQMLTEFQEARKAFKRRPSEA